MLLCSFYRLSKLHLVELLSKQDRSYFPPTVSVAAQRISSVIFFLLSDSCLLPAIHMPPIQCPKCNKSKQVQEYSQRHSCRYSILLHPGQKATTSGCPNMCICFHVTTRLPGGCICISPLQIIFMCVLLQRCLKYVHTYLSSFS